MKTRVKITVNHVLVAAFVLIVAALLSIDFFPALFGVNPTNFFSCDSREAVNWLSNEYYLGLNLNGKSFPYVECDLSRGGYVKARVSSKSDLADVCFHWGWGSSSGADSGWVAALESNDGENALYDEFKQAICGKLAAYSYEPNPSCATLKTNDTLAMQQACLRGDFEEKSGARKTLRVNQDCGRCFCAVEKGPVDCAANRN